MIAEVKHCCIACFLFFSGSLLFARSVRVGTFGQLKYISKYAPGINSNYYSEYLRRIAEKAGWSYETVPMDYDTVLEKMKDGTIDLLYDMSYTEARAKDGFLFSESPCAAEYELLVTGRGNNRFFNGDISSLQNTRIGILGNDPLQEPTLDGFSRKNGLHISKVYYLSSYG